MNAGRATNFLLSYLAAACFVAFLLLISGCSLRDIGLYPPIIFPNAGH